MSKVLRKIRYTDFWSVRSADWTPEPGVPSACLADLADPESSPSFYILEDLDTVTVAAALAAGGTVEAGSAKIAVFDESVFSDFTRGPSATPGDTPIDRVNGAHVVLHRANVTELLPFLERMHEEVSTATTQADMSTSGLRVITKREIVDELRRLVDEQELDPNRLNKRVREQLGLGN